MLLPGRWDASSLDRRRGPTGRRQPAHVTVGARPAWPEGGRRRRVAGVQHSADKQRRRRATSPQPEAQTPAAAQPPIETTRARPEPKRTSTRRPDRTNRWGSLGKWAGGPRGDRRVTVPDVLACWPRSVRSSRSAPATGRAAPSDRFAGRGQPPMRSRRGRMDEMDRRSIASMERRRRGGPHELRRLATMSTAASSAIAVSTPSTSTGYRASRRDAMAARLDTVARLSWDSAAALHPPTARQSPSDAAIDRLARETVRVRRGKRPPSARMVTTRTLPMRVRRRPFELGVRSGVAVADGASQSYRGFSYPRSCPGNSAFAQSHAESQSRNTMPPCDAEPVAHVGPHRHTQRRPAADPPNRCPAQARSRRARTSRPASGSITASPC